MSVTYTTHSSGQRRILNPLSDARDLIRILMDTSQIFNLLSHNRNSYSTFYHVNFLSPPPFYGCTCGIYKFLGQGLNQSCSWGLHHSHGNTGFKPLL